MDAYAVFEGGGVKGAAFTGALQAAEENNIKFVGYGGASAGAIIAYLSAIGLNAQDILNAMKKFNVASLLNESHSGDIENFLSFTDALKSSKFAILKQPVKAMRSCRFLGRAFASAWFDLGISDDRNFISFLSFYLQEKYPDKMHWCETKEDLSITFEKLFSITGIELKIIATNLNSGSATVFSHIDTPSMCVFRAIVASSSYPLLFKPQTDDSSMYIDGGVSCNLPTYLFHGDKYKNLPIFAFDLYKDKDSIVKPSPKGLFGFGKRLMGSMLDASTDIISDVVGGIGVPVKVPEHVSTLNLNASDSVIQELYESGYQSSKDFFDKHPFTVLVKDGPTSRDKAQLLFGNCHEPVLRALLNDINAYPSSVPVKSWLYTSINAIDSEIVSFAKYALNGGVTHHEFPLSDTQNDCVRCWSLRKIVISTNANQPKTRICLPILKRGFKIKNGVQYFLDEKNCFNYTDEEPILGVLCVSVDLPLDNCIWLDIQEDGSISPSEDFLLISQSYIPVIEKAMLGSMSALQFKVESNV
ncbi:patatin-like phospholipase family protein [Vibrio fortis]|uniref:patatin-like phospholipase family protein n=1 Tax=Vibrio fortis TaxID=212667 RepID=UPI000A3FED76